jgi:hypothetical protein
METYFEYGDRYGAMGNAEMRQLRKSYIVYA